MTNEAWLRYVLTFSAYLQCRLKSLTLQTNISNVVISPDKQKNISL